MQDSSIEDDSDEEDSLPAATSTNYQKALEELKLFEDYIDSRGRMNVLQFFIDHRKTFPTLIGAALIKSQKIFFLNYHFFRVLSNSK